MPEKTKLERLIEDTEERYKRLGTYRAVATELDDKVSCALIRDVRINGVWSAKLARVVGIEPKRTRFAADCSVELQQAIRKQGELIDATNGEMLELMFHAWWYQEFAEYWTPVLRRVKMDSKFVMTEEQMKAILQESQDEIATALVEEAKLNVARELRYKMDKEIGAIVTEFIRDEIAPGIRTHLVANKSVILDSALESSNEIAARIGKALLETLTENLSSSYKRNNVMKALFD